MNPGAARAYRIAMYASWLQHDADGLAFNLIPLPHVVDDTSEVLTMARVKLVTALELIDNAIAVDRAANEMESVS